MRTNTTPELEKGGLSDSPRIVTSLLLYGTDTLYLLPKTVKRFTLGSAPGQNIAIPSPFVSAQHKHTARANARAAPRTSQPAPANVADMPGSYDPGGHANGTEAAMLVANDDPGADEVLDVDGATRLLRIGRNTLYELVARSEIPHRRLGKQIRFNQAAVMRWLDSWSSQGAKERQ